MVFYEVTFDRIFLQSHSPFQFRSRKDFEERISDHYVDCPRFYTFSDYKEACAKFEKLKELLSFTYDHGSMYYLDIEEVKLHRYEQAKPGADFKNFKLLKVARPDIPFKEF